MSLNNWYIERIDDSIQITNPYNETLYITPLNTLIIDKINNNKIELSNMENNIVFNINYNDVIEPISSDIDDLILNLQSILFTDSGGGGSAPVQTILSGDTTHSPSSDIIYTNLQKLNTRQISGGADGLGSAVYPGSLGFKIPSYNGTITSWSIIADIAGDIVIDVKKNGVSMIGAGNKPTLSASSSASANVSGWTSTAIVAGDNIELVILSAATLTKFTVEINASIII